MPINNLRVAACKAYRGTVVFEIRSMMAEERRWQRKATIARNKLADVRSRINKLAKKLACEKVGITDEN